MIKKTLGLFVIILGILLFLSNAEIIDFNEISEYLLPSLVLIIGVVGMVERRKVDIFYLILFLLGLSSLILALEIFDKSIVGLLLFPVIIVLIGVRILNIKTIKKDSNGGKSYCALFGGLEEKVVNKEFESCDVTALFGGCTVDLSDIKLKDNKGHINVFVLFGGVDLILPKKHKVTSEGLPLFGAFDNKNLVEKEDSKNEITITYTVVFGGIEIKN
ncbi:MAG: LiaF-related protein [Bacilli bacterium]|nr:LiaF-related protein [Bacilli bacterium]